MGLRVCSFARVSSDGAVVWCLELINSSKEILTFPLGSGMPPHPSGESSRVRGGSQDGPHPHGPLEEPRSLVPYTNCYPLTSNYPLVRAINYKSEANWGN